MNDSLSPRLLSLLSLIETALGDGVPSGAVIRSADYRSGVARMTFAGSAGGIVLQNYQLADGQLCVRVVMRHADSARSAETIETAIYPKSGPFDWSAEAKRIAQTWLDRAAQIDAPAMVSA
ncbi:hypothetical protein [Rariglobus hedericola]|uniref:Uncharacterized protein n=1 Tax=Rariglobus hedericola TaxID=2597822 RepID=A0A556QPM4_9BACT|nr:hypothetical protein [Rariglobus hedericola]TSJ78586.1 hypothetical protein FPL22_04600 [Rariglobus hedericola]